MGVLPLALLAAVVSAGETKAKPKLLNLLEQDADAAWAVPLTGVFQVFVDNKKLKKPIASGAKPPADEDPGDLRALCSASYIGGGRAVTASHCFHGKPAKAMVLRRHKWRVDGRRIVRDGYEDRRIGEPAERRGDLVVVPILDGDAAAPAYFHLPPASFEYADGLPFAALGYPSDFYAAPHLAAGCRVLEPAEDALGAPGYAARCEAEGGMSGGPQFIQDGTQIGIVSLSEGTAAPGRTTSALASGL